VTFSVEVVSVAHDNVYWVIIIISYLLLTILSNALVKLKKGLHPELYPCILGGSFVFKGCEEIGY
jgi:hypothetical protein